MVCMKKTPKIPIFLFLKAIGFNHKAIYHNFSPYYQFDARYPHQDLEALLREETESAKNLNYFNRELTLAPDLASEFTHQLAQELISTESYQNRLFKKFLNIKHYDLGENGRRRLNSKLGLSIKTTVLTELDFLRITYFLIDVYRSQVDFDDIDNLKNRRVRTIGEFLQVQIQQALFRLNKVLTEKTKKHRILPYLISTKPLNSVMHEFFNSCALSQFLDQVNPLAELTHKRRISALGPNGVKRDTASLDLRSIHSTYFSRVCPIETPEGKNAGLVNSLTVLSKTNRDGFIEAIYQKVYNNQVQKQSKPIFLPASIERDFAITSADNYLSKLHFLPDSDIVIRKNDQFLSNQTDKIQFCHYSPLQLFSVATSIVPFFEHNDANRVLMGSNMQRQALPLIFADAAHIRTHLSKRVISDTNYTAKTTETGIVVYTSKEQMHLYVPKISSTNFVRSSNDNLKRTKCSVKAFKLNYAIVDFMADNKLIYCHAKSKLNNSNFNHHSIRGIFNLFQYRKNKCNFIQSVCKSKNLRFYFSIQLYHLQIQAQMHSHLHFRPFNLFKQFFSSSIVLNSYMNEFVPLSQYEIKNKTFQPFEHTNQGTFQIQKPIISTLEWLHKGDLIADCATSENGQLALGRNLLVAYLPWDGLNFEDAIILNENLIREDKFVSVHIEKYEVIIEMDENIDKIERITRDLPNKNINIDHLDSNGIIKLGSKVMPGQILIGKVCPIDQRPLLPHEKLLYDIIGKKQSKVRDASLYAPAHIEGRIIYISLNNHAYFAQPFSHQKYIDEWEPIKVCLYIADKRNLQVGDKLSGRHGNKGVISKILPHHDLPFLLTGEIVDIVLNPLGVPSRMNVGQLFESVLGLVSYRLKENYTVEIFDERYGFQASRSLVYFKLLQLRNKIKQKWYFSLSCPGKMFLLDGRTGEKFIEPATIGYTYILKLVHLVEEKIHARSTGPYSLVTQQPLKGRSKSGGQRFGEMEVWALEGFGSAYVLHELLTIKSDDLTGRTQITDAILNNLDMQFGTPESFKVMVRELQALCLKIEICER